MVKQIDYSLLLVPIQEFFKKHKNLLIIIFSSLAAVVFLVLIIVMRINKNRENFFQKITLAENYLYYKKTEDAFKILDELISLYGKSKFNSYAMYLKAVYLYEQKDFSKTLELCNRILEINKPKTLIVPTMYIKAMCNLNIGKIEDTINILNNIILKYPNHFYIPRVYESLLLCYELTGNKEKAKSIYEKINILYPGSYWSNLLQQKMSTK
ncbi:MAG: tetratricopeptide repeat protein [Endomicrobia bacterium]|nr:tetratricopeptide repeat protein [Endomicrobiia bacterium]